MAGRNPTDSDVVKSIRDLTISRRGGVRTRGGRLPPISLREITQGTSTKKTVAPKIPQRRKTIKQEVETQIKGVSRRDSKVDFPSSRGRGRGRTPKAFIQTDGSFLAEGPAAKVKKEIDHERFSFARSSKSSSADSFERKVDNDTIKDILESYEEYEACKDFFNEMPPYRLPLLKRRDNSKITKIKTEPLDDLGDDVKKDIKKITDIKEEIIIKTEDDQLSSSLKTEDEFKPEVKSAESFQNVAVKTEDDQLSCSLKTEDECKVEVKRNTAESFQNVADDGMTLLLQLPRLLSIKEAETSEKRSTDPPKQEEENESGQGSTILDNLDEGPVGKLQFMKSGRMRLVLGSTVYELEESPSESYLEVASMRLSEGGSTDLMILDKVDRKVVAVPVLENIVPADNKNGQEEKTKCLY